MCQAFEQHSIRAIIKLNFFSCTGCLQLISLIWHLTSYFHTTLSTLCFITPSSSLEVNLSRDTCGPQAPRAELR